MPMPPEALMCAAFLLGYQGDIPPWDWIDRPPRQAECDLALNGRDAAWFAEQQARDGPWECFAVTYYTGSGVIIVGSHDQHVADPFRVWVIEGIRSINAYTRMPMTSQTVYRLAERWRECPQ